MGTFEEEVKKIILHNTGETVTILISPTFLSAEW